MFACKPDVKPPRFSSSNTTRLVDEIVHILNFYFIYAAANVYKHEKPHYQRHKPNSFKKG